jgi:hypothetical protein
MRPQNSFSQKTNITSLATTVGLVAFVIWMTSFGARHDSIIAPAPVIAAAAAPHATPNRSADAQRPDHAAPAVGRG